MSDKLLIVRAKGDGGIVDPGSSAYISSKVDSAAPDTSFVRAKIDENAVDLIDTVDISWDDFLAEVNKTENHNDWEAALQAVRQHPGKAHRDAAAEDKRKAKEAKEAEEAAAKAAAAQAEADKAKTVAENKEVK